MTEPYAHPQIFDFADAINENQRQRGKGTPFLSKPYTYSTGELPACPVCKAVPQRIRVGDLGDVVSFNVVPIPVMLRPCGHLLSIRVDEAELLLGHEEERRRMRRQRELEIGQEADSGEADEGHPEPPSDEELNSVLPVRPDPRQPAYDAVYEYIRALGGYLPPDTVHRNAVIWRAVQAALEATPVGRCESSHCVEGDHILPAESEMP